MAENSKIEWTMHTFNPWRGCTKVAAGCEHCYADTFSKRNPGTLGIWGPNGTRVVASEAMWRVPVKWNAEADCIRSFDCNNGSHSDACPQANRPRVFCASLADVFEDWEGFPTRSVGGNPIYLDRDTWRGSISPDRRATLDDVRRRLFALIDTTPNLDWLLLTKRPENIEAMWPGPSIDTPFAKGNLETKCRRPNVWLGTSIATQADADKNIPELLKCRDLAPVLFVSAEPLLEAVDLTYRRFPGLCPDCCGTGELPSNHPSHGANTGEYDEDGRPYDNCIECENKRLVNGIDWVIEGGESGPKARPRHPDWSRSLRDQCQAAGVPFLLKQHGEYLHLSQWESATTSMDAAIDDNDFMKVGKTTAGRTLDGVIHDGYPKVAYDETKP